MGRWAVRTQPPMATGTLSQTSTIPYHTIPYHTMPFHTVPYHTIPYHTVPYHTIPYHTIPYHTIPDHTIPCHAILCHTIPYHTIPYHTIPWVCYRRRNQWLRLALALFCVPLIWLARVTVPYHTIPYHAMPCHTRPNQTRPYRGFCYRRHIRMHHDHPPCYCRILSTKAGTARLGWIDCVTNYYMSFILPLAAELN